MPTPSHVSRLLFLFTTRQAQSCVFAGLLFIALALSRHWTLCGMARYDFVLLCALLFQVLLWKTRWETTDELNVIGVFHVLGFALQQYKTHAGCWAYPDAAVTKIAGVPLYSGFLYASVASYLCQAWRRLQVQMENWPPARWAVPLACAVYINFFTEGVLGDGRWFLAAAVLVIFWRTRTRFSLDTWEGVLPLPLCFVLCAGGLFRVGGRKHCHTLGRVAVPRPARRVADGTLGQDFVVVAAGDFDLPYRRAIKTGQGRAPGGHSGRSADKHDGGHVPNVCAYRS